MSIRRSDRLRGPQSAQLRAALYYARKRRLARLAGGSGGPVVPAENHRYWRMKVYDDGYGGGYVMFAEVYLREVPGGDDISGSLVSATLDDVSGTYSEANAFDRDPLTYCRTRNTSPPYPVMFELDFGEGNEIELNEITITSFQGGLNWGDESPVLFDVEYSDDGVSWTTFWSVDDPMMGNPETRDFTRPDY